MPAAAHKGRVLCIVADDGVPILRLKIIRVCTCDLCTHFYAEFAFRALESGRRLRFDRRNRLNLLHRIRATCSGVADLTKIEG